MSDNMQQEMHEAMERAAALMADSSVELASAMAKICSELYELSWSNIVCRTLFRCALLEGTAHRARFVSLWLNAEGQPALARFLADHAVSAGAKPWQKRRLTELMGTPPATNFSANARGQYSLSIAADGRVDVGDDMTASVTTSGHESAKGESSEPDNHSSRAEDWLSVLIAQLDQGPVGIHHDVLTIRVGSGEQATSALGRALSSVQLLPVIPLILVDSPLSIPAVLEALSSARSGCLNPVVAAPNSSGQYAIITAGGGELLDAGPTQDLVINTVEDVTTVASALGLINLYDSPALRTHRATVIESFRSESSGLLPLWNSTRAFSRVMRFRGTHRATASLRTALTGHILTSGFIDEARALLETVPPKEHDRVHNARKLRADFGTARFQEAMTRTESKKRSPADESLIREAVAAMALLSDLDAAQQNPPEPFTSAKGKVLSILHASVPDQSGGYAIRAHSVLQTIQASGFDVVAVTRPGFPEVNNTLAPGELQAFEHDGIRYLRLGTQLARAAGEYAYMRESIDYYCDLIRQEHPAVIHLRSTYVSALPALIAAKRFGLPVLYEVSGMWELVYEASNTGRMESRRARTVRFENVVLKNVDGVVTITEAMRDIIDARVSTRRAVEIVPNAVDSEIFTNREKNLEILSQFAWDPTVATIGYIGTFVHYEGLDILIRAFARLREKGVRFQALLVGDGAEATRLQALASELELDETILQFTGRIAHAEVADLYSVIDVCAYPRRLTPATRAVSPLKPFEAMASKKAVVVSDVPALAEIAGHGERALIVPNENVEALADALELVISDPERAEKMVAAAAEWTRSERSWDAVGLVMARMLTSVIETGTASDDGTNGAHEEIGTGPTEV